jgi:hypothetical protein
MLDLLLEFEGASHENLLLEDFVALVEGFPEGFFVTDFVYFVSLD